MQSPPPPPPSMPPPPPPSSGLPPPPPSSGQPPMMPPGYGGGMAPAAGNLASPGLRILGGLIDVVILFVVNVIVSRIALQGNVPGLASLINLVVDLGYFGYLWSSQGASIGMMPFGFKVRDVATGQYPTMGKAILRGFVWVVEAGLTVCLIGAVGWLWQLWDPQRQAIHDKVVGTIVTTS